MNEIDPYRIQIDRLKFEYKRETASERRLASIRRRLEILREWLTLSQKRVKASSTGFGAKDVLDETPGPPDTADLAVVVEVPPQESAQESDGKWVRMIEDCEIDDVHLPAGVVVRVPQAKVEALLATNVCEAMPDSWLGERERGAADTAAEPGAEQQKIG